MQGTAVKYKTVFLPDVGIPTEMEANTPMEVVKMWEQLWREACPNQGEMPKGTILVKEASSRVWEDMFEVRRARYGVTDLVESLICIASYFSKGVKPKTRLH